MDETKTDPVSPSTVEESNKEEKHVMTEQEAEESKVVLEAKVSSSEQVAEPEAK